MINPTESKYIVLILTIILFLLPSAVICAAADTDEKEILVIGNGTVYRDNLASARKSAISDALVKGIEDYLEMTLGSQGMINNFHEVINEIIPASGDAVEKYDILAEDQSEKNYKILVSIKINKKLMEDRLKDYGIILYEGSPLRILFLVSHRLNPEEDMFIWWDDPEYKNRLSSSELTLHRLLQERGFNPVNRLTSIPVEGYNPELFKKDLSIEEAAEWGRLYSSDVVILGRVDTANYNSVMAELKAVNTETSKVISSSSNEILQHDSNAADTDPVGSSQEKVLIETVNSLIPDILISFKEKEEKETEFEISLRGLDSLKQVFSFISFLKNDIRGTISVIQTRIKEEELRISVEFTGSRESFIEKVKSNTKIPFPVNIDIDKETDSLNITAR